MNQDEDRAAAQPAGKRSISVKAKLRNAFIGIAAFSLLAALVGVVSYQAVHLAQQDIIEQALPAARHVGEILEKGATAIDSVALVAAALNDEDIVRQRHRTADIEKQMRAELAQLPQTGPIRETLSRFEKTIDQIFALLHEQKALVVERNQLLAARDQLADTAFHSLRSISETLRPAIIEATSRSFRNTDRIRAALAPNNDKSQEAAELFDRLISEDIRQIQILTRIRAQTASMVNNFESLLETRKPNSVAVIRDKLNIQLRSLGRMTIETRDRPLQRTVGPYLGKISMAIRGTDNIVALQTAYLRTVANIDRSTMLSRDLGESFVIITSELRQAVDQMISAATQSAENAVQYGRISLILIAILALLSAIWVIWRYVWTDVVARIERVAAITRRLASGDLNVEIDIKGSDELGDVADAMRLFKANANELRRSNAELEQFAYVASHDLKAPLRGISNLASWIEEDIGDAMTAESKKHLGLLNNRIDRLGALLEDLLQYSRAGRETNEIRTVDLAEDLPELFRLVSANDRFNLELENRMPKLETAAAPIEQIFRNLISNAIKHHDKDKGTLTIVSRRLGDRYEFIVRDDGPGIAPEYQERIFGMFQTIRSRDEVEGSGIGLSVSKKLVESVNCSIWVESSPETQRGAAIHFTWPVRWPNALNAGPNN